MSCWQAIPESRPLFDKLEECIVKILGGTLAEQYIELNEPYVESNINRFKNGNIDYLALMNPSESKPSNKPTISKEYSDYRISETMSHFDVKL